SGEALVEALAHLRFALRALALMPGADFAADEMAVAICIDLGVMLDQRIGALAAGIGDGLDFGTAEAAIAIGVQPRMVAVGAVLSTLAAMVAMPALRALAGVEASVAVAVQ